MLKETTNIDWGSVLEGSITKRAYKLNDIPAGSLEKVAFDVVRFKDPDVSADLWQVQTGEDGQQYIMALYNPEDAEENVKTSAWQVSLSKTAGELQVSYKGDPLVKIAASKLGLGSKEEASKVPGYLPERLASNKKLVTALLNELDVSVRNVVLRKYPELV